MAAALRTVSHTLTRRKYIPVGSFPPVRGSNGQRSVNRFSANHLALKTDYFLTDLKNLLTSD